VKLSLLVVEVEMKSFSKVYSPSAHEQLTTWTPSELDIEFAVLPAKVQKEQILAILRNNENQPGGVEKKAKSILRPRMTDLTFNVWQLEEIDLQPPLKQEDTWDFVEAPSEADAPPTQERWTDQPDREKEAEEILKRAHLQAEEILLEARATADNIILQAQDEIDSEKQEAYRQGWNEGRNELGQALHAIHAVAEEVVQWRDSLTAQGEQILVEMLKDIAQTMFGEGVHLDANSLQINLNRMMEHAQKLGDLNIFLNVRDAEILDHSWSEYQLLITGNRVKIIPSEKIAPGGCIVKGNMGMIDGRVETQLAAVLNTIEEIRGAKE
jgi:flagellar assembly protein FliH